MKKAALIILDGWGIGKHDNSDGIFRAKTPFVDSLYTKYKHNTLITYGEDVGLPEGQMGNSEVGHMNIGAGRVVYQDLVRINNEIKNGLFFQNKTFLDAILYANSNNKKIHLLGLVSRGGVHSSQDHLYALCDLIAENIEQKDKVFIHAFTDGRDCAPDSGLQYMAELEKHIANQPIAIGSIIGRYYAMDRDSRWERIKKAYDLMVDGVGAPFVNVTSAIQQSYDNEITDEFIEPLVNTKVNGKITAGDVVICFNFRTDRCREITMALHQQDFEDFEMQKIPLHYITMTNYNKSFEDIRVAYDKDELIDTLGEIVSKNGSTQLRIAETEKYPHVSFFFSGGKEIPFQGENRIMVNSPKVATYDLQPEMSAPEVTEQVVEQMKTEQPDFICLNFANGDMVGHTGVQSAIIKACETVDKCLQKVVETGLANGYSFVIIADHGNADKMYNEDGSPHTAHTLNLVPCIVIDDRVASVSKGRLADVAPTILHLMDIEQPSAMTGGKLAKFTS